MASIKQDINRTSDCDCSRRQSHNHLLSNGLPMGWNVLKTGHLHRCHGLSLTSKPSRKRDTYDSEMTHLPHGNGLQRLHSELGNGDTMGTFNPTRTRQERFGRREDDLQGIAVHEVAIFPTGIPTRHHDSGQPDRYETFIGHMSHRTRHKPVKPAKRQDINRAFERATYGHKGQGNGSQTAQMAHVNGPDMGQNGHNRAINAPNAPRTTGEGLIA